MHNVIIFGKPPGYSPQHEPDETVRAVDFFGVAMALFAAMMITVCVLFATLFLP